MPPRRATVKKVSTLKLNSAPSNAKKSKPVFAVPKLATPSSSKVKAKVVPPTPPKTTQRTQSDGQLWVDFYQPREESELAVHKGKVGEVRNWLTEALHGGPNGSLKKYRRILVMTGRAGTGKTATLRVLAADMDFDILEWTNSTDDPFTEEMEYESVASKFQSFLFRAATCRPLTSTRQHQVILVEDLPNVLHQGTLESFQASLETFVDAPPSCPLVIIISDAGLRGEDQDQNGWRAKSNAIDIRTVLPTSLRDSPYVNEIRFNPIAATFLKKALSAICAAASSPISKEAQDIIIESSNGDIRSAIMAIQFASVVKLPTGKSKKNAGNVKYVLEAVTRREQSLVLFHLLGKVFYNKRVGDPPNPSSSTKDIEREAERDAKIPKPPPLPRHLSHWARKASKVDVNNIYSDSPVDTSLFSLYLHQNYTQFCDEVEECAGVADWLSWTDMGDFHQSQSSLPSLPFQLLALGSLVSLPSPVQRRSQQILKPEFFSVLKKENDADMAVEEVREWLIRFGHSAWDKGSVKLEVGSWLKALDNARGTTAPPPHRAFTHIPFVLQSKPRGVRLNAEDDEGVEGEVPLQPAYENRRWRKREHVNDGDSSEDDGDGALEEDGIDAF